MNARATLGHKRKKVSGAAGYTPLEHATGAVAQMTRKMLSVLVRPRKVYLENRGSWRVPSVADHGH